jgi:hypothetical protein
MKNTLKIISLVGLVLTILPSMLVFKGVIELKLHYILMIIGMVLWFGSAPFWMRSKSLEEAEQ